MSSYLFIVKIELPRIIEGLFELPDNYPWVPEQADADVPDTVGFKYETILKI